MKATTYLGTGLVALAFVFAGGCDSVEDVEDGDFVEPLPKVVQITEGADGAKIVSFRALADNGTEANGYRMNGYRMNGYRMNGYRMNGYRMNGYRMNGSALNNVFLNLFGVLQGDEGVMGENDEITLDSDNDVLEEDYEIKLSEQETVPGRSQFKFQRIRYRVKPGTTWDDACRDGYDNPTKGILVRYVFDEDTGEILDTPTDGTSWACRGTAMGKCIEWAWHPDDSGTDRFTNDTNVSFYDIYRACTRMVRADYNGNGTHHTQNGTPIDIEGRFGLQNHETLWQIEAAWGPDGALCLNSPRKTFHTRAAVEAERGEAIPTCGTHNGTLADLNAKKQVWYDAGALLITLNVPSS